MRIPLSIVAAALMHFAFHCSAALAETADEHKVVAPHDLKWGAGPESLPPGAETVVLYGDPKKEGLFALRLKLPKGYHIPPHTHPKPEIVTIISGEGRLGMGESTNEETIHKLTAGSFMAMPPNTAHYVYADEEMVVQLNSTGPWKLNYIDPEDDPRKGMN